MLLTLFLCQISEQPLIATEWFTVQWLRKRKHMPIPMVTVSLDSVLGHSVHYMMEGEITNKHWHAHYLTSSRQEMVLSHTRYLMVLRYSASVLVGVSMQGKGGSTRLQISRQARKKLTHPFARTLAPLLVAFPSLRLLRSSSVRTPTPAGGFFANLDATSRPSPEGDGEELPSSSSSSTTSFKSGSSAPLPPRKYKSRKTPKHTAITTTLPWIRMVKATCCRWVRQRGLRSCLRVRESGPSWHFVTAPRSHFSADDDGERRGAFLRLQRIARRRCGFSGITVMTTVNYTECTELYWHYGLEPI